MQNLKSMGLDLAYRGSKIIETLENYAVAEDIRLQSLIQTELESTRFYHSDHQFWIDAFREKLGLHGRSVSLFNFVVCDWVARIPGLYWTKQAQALRMHNEVDVAFQSREWIQFTPPGKSKKVLGGIGTLLLPPTDDGKVLISISAGCNASAGIPMLIYPDVMDELDIRQGDMVDIRNAKWQAMSSEWSKQFAFSQDVPRGYLVIDKLEKVTKRSSNYPVVYHPFSIMEYEHEDALLYDFVYTSADTQVSNVDEKLEKFFDDYSKENGRNGKYLLNPNIVQPLFETQFSSPSELSHPSQKAKLLLIYHRINDAYFNEVNINQLINELPKHYQSSASIRALTTRIGLSSALLSEDSAASMSAQLISMCIEKDFIVNLIDRMIWEYPKIFKK